MRNRMVTTISAVLVVFMALPVLADWSAGDGYKMHYPQMPDPLGWDVNIDPFDDGGMAIADDWLCTETGPVTDLHIWGSWKLDNVGELEAINVEIYSDDIINHQPGDNLWAGSFTAVDIAERFWGTGDQGWLDPWTGEYSQGDHTLIYQYNMVDIPEPFIQEAGNTYWLCVYVFTTSGQFGWKTSSDHFGDGAVMVTPQLTWDPLLDPVTQLPLDMAFVITPEPATLWLLALLGLMLVRRVRR